MSSSYITDFNETQKFVLDEEHMTLSLKNKIVPDINVKSFANVNVKNKHTQQQQMTSNNSHLFSPLQQDSLFWCFFIIKNGFVDYETIYQKNSVKTQQLKIDMVQTIRNNKDVLKTYKFDTITNIENNLGNETQLNVKTFLSLCAIENINICYVRGKTFFELRMNDDGPNYILREMSASTKYHIKYGFEIGDKEMLEDIRQTLYQILVINKPIKSISAYKATELIDLMKKLSIDYTNKTTGKNMLKNEIYEEIVKSF